MPNTNSHKERQKRIVFAFSGVLIFMAAGVSSYFFLASNSATPEQELIQPQQPISEAEAKEEASAVLSKIQMGMTKEEVFSLVGRPSSCKKSTGNDGDFSYIMERCSYGKSTAPGHASIIFMNEKVWGTSYTIGPA